MALVKPYHRFRGTASFTAATPITEYWTVNGGLLMPYNRGNLDRMPFLWYANLYADPQLGQQALRLHKKSTGQFQLPCAFFTEEQD